MALRASEAVLAGVSTWRDYKLHKAREKMEIDNHNIEIKLMKEHHAKEENLAKQIYLVEKFTEIEQHFQQLNADLLTVSKESGKHFLLWLFPNNEFRGIQISRIHFIYRLLSKTLRLNNIHSPLLRKTLE